MDNASMSKYVTFEPVGFRDVYYCFLVNEPCFASYASGRDKYDCPKCHCELPDGNYHVFICHINKPRELNPIC